MLLDAGTACAGADLGYDRRRCPRRLPPGKPRPGSLERAFSDLSGDCCGFGSPIWGCCVMPKGWKPHQVFNGDQYGRLQVIGFSHSDKRYRRHYLVRCSCGSEKTVQGTLLRSGNTQSCGCLVPDAARLRVIPNDLAAINQIILRYKRHARDRGISWGLSVGDVSAIVRLPCHYCGCIAGNTFRSKSIPGFHHNGIDRVDNKIGYFQGNVAPCCGICNVAKGTRASSEFIAWATAIANQWAN